MIAFTGIIGDDNHGYQDKTDKNPSSRQLALSIYHSLSTLLAPMHHNIYQCKEN
jgi:hypothetical protein